MARLYIKLFDLKDEMLRNNEYMIDFTENNFQVNYLDPYLRVIRVVLVEDRHLCRPDLICWEAYGTTDYMDGLMKFNQISNPFSMDLYDFIVVPHADSYPRFYQKQNKISKIINNTKALFLDPKRASQKDVNRLKQLAKLAQKRKNGSVEPKPTNLLRPGEVPFETNGTAIVFAPSVSTPRPSTTNGI
jgi:hypothetical protein